MKEGLRNQNRRCVGFETRCIIKRKVGKHMLIVCEISCGCFNAYEGWKAGWGCVCGCQSSRGKRRSVNHDSYEV
jgi:hypothetical protein